jgi:hypothetical protein
MIKEFDNIRVTIPKSWEELDNPQGPYTLIKSNNDEPGVLQISVANYLSGALPNPSLETLVELSENIGNKNNFGDVLSKASGNCDFGSYGRVDFKSEEHPLIAVWHLSDKKNFVFATFICSKYPEEVEMKEAEKIIMTIRSKKSFLGKILGST